LLTNKNEVLQQIADTAKQLSLQDKETKEIHKKIASIIRSNLSVDDNWGDFVAHFDKVHPHFFDRLKENHPNLTEHNLRLCAYFRIGIPPKQIAQMLNVSIDNIKKIRYRLKKKFNLEENENIDDFLRNI
jgi:DNA-binding NarL/FixJ family response regulator